MPRSACETMRMCGCSRRRRISSVPSVEPPSQMMCCNSAQPSRRADCAETEATVSSMSEAAFRQGVTTENFIEYPLF